jgi:hypothetical protein
MKPELKMTIICAALLLGGAAARADEKAKPIALTAPASAARAVPLAPAASARFADPGLLSPPGFEAQDLPAYDDFLHRAIAQKRIEIVRFVDRDDRRVFLGLTRDGYLGIHVQKRDRR